VGILAPLGRMFLHQAELILRNILHKIRTVEEFQVEPRL
jgi:hypothetical protein